LNLDSILSIDVAGLRIFGRADPLQPHGLFLGPDGFTGWDDGVDMRRDDAPRPSAAGSFPETGFLGTRTIVLGGTAFAASPQELMHLGRRFRGVLASGTTGRVSLSRHGSTEWARAALAAGARPLFAIRGRTPQVADWQLTLWCPDPRKFGDRTPLRTTGPGETQPIYHRGNYPAAPQLIVRGNMPNGYRVEGPGFTYVVARAVTPEAPHRIDNATGLLSIGGAVQLNAITSGTGWVIAPDTAPVTHKLLPVTGTGTLETELYSTYI